MLFVKNKIKIPDDAEDMHLCYLGEEGYHAEHTKIFQKLASDPEYVCEHCGRTAHDKKNLCTPERI